MNFLLKKLSKKKNLPADLYEGLKAATVVLEGDTVMLNCTPTLPDATVTFSGSAVSEFPHDNVLSFPALERLDGFYRCTVVFPSSTSITQTTTVYIVPGRMKHTSKKYIICSFEGTICILSMLRFFYFFF